MTLTFVSNYINHHQIPVSEELYRQLGEDYHFIQVEPMAKERVEMGWGAELSGLTYLKCYYEEPEYCRKLILDSDIVIFGGVEDESYIRPRLREGGIVIRYSERLYREGQWKAVSPRGLIKKYFDHTRYRYKPVYLLCSGAYVASDFHIVHAYPGRMMKWGYFPETRSYDVKRLLADKRQKTVQILWAGRFLALKHPEYALRLAETLKRKGYDFSLTMIGGGELEEALKREAREKALLDVVSFAGYKKPDEVREYMEKANVFLFTSDYLEGWGAVLNESMNSGCAVVADAKIGAVPYLIRHGQNGLVYADGDMEEFLCYGERLVKEQELREELGRNAYETIAGLWNPKNAAKQLLYFCTGVLHGKEEFSEEGPVSKALVISPRKGYSYTRRK